MLSFNPSNLNKAAAGFSKPQWEAGAPHGHSIAENSDEPPPMSFGGKMLENMNQ